MIQAQPNISKLPLNGIAHIKVLLAEDNEVNKLLAKSMLQYWGIESKTASTGNEVIALITQEDFDLVLMDIQMPEKSGIEAAREIRRLGDSKKRNVPIIALTANALIGEEQKYRAAGMDDFLTKPFKANELENVISRVINNAGSFGRDLQSVTHESPVERMSVYNVASEEKLYDLKSVHEIARGSQEFVLMLVNIFLDTIPADSHAMVVACNEKKWDSVSKLAHKLKSTVDTMHMVSIKEVVRTVESDAKQGINKETLPALVQKIDTVIAATAAHLRHEFNLA